MIITLRIFKVASRFTAAGFTLDASPHYEPIKGAGSAGRQIRQKSAAKNLPLLHGKPVVAQRMGAAA
jgi:hypothetical protein